MPCKLTKKYEVKVNRYKVVAFFVGPVDLIKQSARNPTYTLNYFSKCNKPLYSFIFLHPSYTLRGLKEGALALL